MIIGLKYSTWKIFTDRLGKIPSNTMIDIINLEKKRLKWQSPTITKMKGIPSIKV